MWMMTAEYKDTLIKQRDSKFSELNILKEKTPKSIWEDDLDALEKKLDKIEENELRKVLGINAVNSMEMDRFEASSSKAISTKIAVTAKIYPLKKNESGSKTMNRFEASSSSKAISTKIAATANKIYPSKKNESESESMDDEEDSNGNSSSTSLPKRIGTSRQAATKVENYAELTESESESGSSEQSSSDEEEFDIDFQKDKNESMKRKYQSDSDESMSLAPEGEMDDDSSIMVCYKIHIEIVFLFYIFFIDINWVFFCVCI